MGLVVFMVMMAIIAALRKSIGLIQLMECNHLMCNEMTRANKNDGRWICKSNDICGWMKKFNQIAKIMTF